MRGRRMHRGGAQEDAAIHERYSTVSRVYMSSRHLHFSPSGKAHMHTQLRRDVAQHKRTRLGALFLRACARTRQFDIIQFERKEKSRLRKAWERERTVRTNCLDRCLVPDIVDGASRPRMINAPVPGRRMYCTSEGRMGVH